MALESTPCKIGDTWCIYTDQSWDCVGDDWQIVSYDGRPMAWMCWWDGVHYSGGSSEGVVHYDKWNDPAIKEFKATCKLKQEDIMRLWCEIRMDLDGSYREMSDEDEDEDLQEVQYDSTDNEY